ncbi:mitochondrial pyruvate carrier 2-like [Lytechinus variegatus]|uniref:mitochondrial pyruvate carrier 2-like n=1 Tax=Lytechinus variegatus TaxID=7654 RepID=UPI001BB1D824|nr:mitochondrial pyruvate carrier 2-like [Lytechinus variegatus]
MASRRHAVLTCIRFFSRQQQHRGLADAAPKQQSLWANVDAKIELALPEKLKPLWNHPAGMKTIHFWAPCFKWCLVFAGIADYTRPAEKLSVRQSGALAATGVIWARYSIVIIPKNWNLFSVNFFLGLTGLMQLLRIYLYTKEQEKLAAEKASELVSESTTTTVTQA